MNQDEIRQIIQDVITANFSQRRIGDTPTDALQLVPKKYVDGKIYGGYVNSDGTKGTPFPTSWTTSYLSTGDYRVTHNLGTTSYNLSATSGGGVFRTMSIYDRSANTFEVASLNVGAAPGAVDSAFSFILVKG